VVNYYVTVVRYFFGGDGGVVHCGARVVGNNDNVRHTVVDVVDHDDVMYYVLALVLWILV